MAAVTSRAAKPLAAAAIAQLEADGVATLIGTVVNPAGLTHAKMPSAWLETSGSASI
jgi:glutamine synthetase